MAKKSQVVKPTSRQTEDDVIPLKPKKETATYEEGGKGRKQCPKCEKNGDITFVGGRTPECPVCQYQFPVKAKTEKAEKSSGFQPEAYEETFLDQVNNVAHMFQQVRELGGLSKLQAAVDAASAVDATLAKFGGLQGAKDVLEACTTMNQDLADLMKGSKGKKAS